MTRALLLILCLGFVAACDSGGGDVLQAGTQEPDPDNGGGGDGGSDDEAPIDGDGRTPELPPGTANPTPDRSIVRREPQDGDGGGFATNIEYQNDEGQDEFVVDNIAFDGNNVYTRGDPVTGVAQLGPYAVYEGAETTEDPVTGNTLSTFTYRAIYGRSESGETEFAIVRSGSYIDYGFGGFIYQRNETDFDGNPVTLVLPNEGDAFYTGDYAGIRVFQGRGGLEYVRGDSELTIDFKDFNNGQRGVALYVRNRQLFDSAGNNITEEYLTALNENGGGVGGGGFGDLVDDEDGGTDGKVLIRDGNGDGIESLPPIRPIISPTNADSNGEIIGDVREVAAFTDGTSENTGSGTFYGIMSGTDVGEIVGVVVIEGTDPRVSGTNYQETGGFVVYRQ